MPLFEYACANCGHVFEKLVLRRDSEPPECPKCGWNQVEQIYSAFATAGSRGKSTSVVCAPSGGG